MTLTIQDALSMLNSRDYVVAPQVCGLPSGSSRELQAFLIRTLEEHERVMKDAVRIDWIEIHGSFGVDSATGLTGGNGQKHFAATRSAIDAQITKEQA